MKDKTILSISILLIFLFIISFVYIEKAYAENVSKLIQEMQAEQRIKNADKQYEINQESKEWEEERKRLEEHVQRNNINSYLEKIGMPKPY